MDTEEVAARMRRIGALVKNLSRRINKSRGGHKSHHPDLTLSQARTIWLLNEIESLTMSELAGRSGVSRPAATSNADALQKLGLIARFADPGDRRVVRIRLSKKGKNWCAEHRKHHRENMAQLLSKLSDAERAELAASLERTYSILSRIDPDLKGYVCASSAE
jgi:DNA-binding MarR family transcriptional regulator